MLQITPRAYIIPFSLLILCHHLPLWILWSAFNTPISNTCYENFKVWTHQTFVLHVAIPCACTLSMFITIISPIYRSKSTFTLNEVPIIVVVFLLYVALGIWDLYGLQRSVIDECLSTTNHSGIIVFDLIVSAFVVIIWLFSACTWKQRTQDDMRLECMKRLRCLTLAFVCKRYDDDGDGNIYSFLAESMSKFFYVRRRDFEHVLPFSDVIFALQLVAKRQLNERRALPPPSPSVVISDPFMLDDAVRYGKLAGGIYGWRLFLYYHPFSFHKAFACCQSRELNRHLDTVRDVSTWAHRHPGPRDDVSFVRYTGLDHTSVQYISNANGLFRVPFSVCRDEDRREVIVCIRGSFSWHDVLTDILGHTVAMNADDTMTSPGGETIYTHDGVLRAARHLYHELQSGILKQSFWDFAISKCRLDDPDAQWRIVLTGHSLGGGIASILTLMLRKEFHAFGYLFAPMPVLDEHTAAWSSPYMTTFIYGDDWVPRLTVPNLIRLRNELMQEYQLVSNVSLFSIWCAGFDPTKIEPHIHPEWADLELLQHDAAVSLTIPGSIFQISPENEARLCSCEWLFGPQSLQCVRRNRLDFDRIWVNYRAAVDHFPHHYDHSIALMQKSLRGNAPQEIV